MYQEHVYQHDCPTPTQYVHYSAKLVHRCDGQLVLFSCDVYATYRHYYLQFTPNFR